MGLAVSKVQLPPLGIGITYSSAVEPIIQEHPDLVDVLEIEPQMMWLETRYGPNPYRVSEAVLEHLAQLPGRKIVHSIGVPVGGTVRPEPSQLALLRRTIEHFNSPWASEHLSFNSTREFRTGFFLPPRQTMVGVKTAVASIHDLQAALSVPIAVETGVNYLQPRPDEMADGAFVATVVEMADCGLLLDLHNVFANAVNGRQPVDDFLNQLPLERVWELHIAGGFELEGFWLDAHSGAIPDALFEIAKSVVQASPNLKAIIFEIYPSFIPIVGYAEICRELERLHELWELRSQLPTTEPTLPLHFPIGTANPSESIPPAAWEQALGGLVIGRAPDHPLAHELAKDAGVHLVNRLVAEFRASMIVSVLRLTSRHLMLALGPDIFRAILGEFWTKTPPQQYAATEAQAFANFLGALDLRVPQLGKLIEYERAVLATLVDQQPRVIEFDFDPMPLFRALAEGHMPDMPPQLGRFEIEITPDDSLGSIDLEPSLHQQGFPFH